MGNNRNEFGPSLNLPDNSSGSIYCYSGLIGSLGGAVISIYYAIRSQSVVFFAVPIFVAVAYLFYRAISTSTPNTIAISGDMVILTNVPSFSIWLENAIIPLVISKQVSVKAAEFHLEWLGKSLTWNDLQGGKSVHLAHASEAQPLLAWLSFHGISIPQVPL